MARIEVTIVVSESFRNLLEVFSDPLLMWVDMREILLFTTGDNQMTTNKNNAYEQVIREAFRTMDADSAREIREAFYKAVEGLHMLAETLEVADNGVGDTNDHA